METSNTYLDGLKQKLMPYLKDYLEEHNIKVTAQGKFRCINPEHKDDNPSASFHPESKNQVFNCFSCGAKGTIVDAAHFLEDKPTTGREFIYENLFYLADKYNIPYNDKFEVTEEEIYRSEVYKAYAEASDIISENQPIEYLKKRKWPVSLCREYGVGTVKSYEDFMTRLSNRGFTKDFLRDIDFNSQLYTPNMLLFEIRNEKGKIVGFAGRDMTFKKGSKSFKFRNTSSKCPIYHKSSILYGLYAAKKSVPPLYIFEGYPDWITAQKHGLLNSCAIGGTALTYEHINLIKALNIRDIILCLDGDNSGQDKTEKLLDEHFSGEEALRIKIVKMPSETEECDPDDYLDKHGLDAFRKLPLMDAFEWRLSRFPYDFDKEDVCDRMIPLIVNEPNNIRREGMCKHLSEFAGVRLKAIQRQLDSILNYEEARIKEKENAKVRQVMSEINEREGDPVAIFEEALEDIRKLRSTNSDEVHSSDELMTYMTDVREKFEDRQAGLLDFKTGWDIFDDAFSGIPREDNMITFAGDSNLGKTGFMFNLAYRIAKYNDDACVLFMSIDDSRQQAIPRLVSISSGLEIRQVTHPTEHVHSDEDKKKLDDGWRDMTSMMAEGRFAIKDVSHGVDLNFAENWIRYMQDKYPEKQVIFFLDNFHKLSDESAKDERIRFKHASGRIHAMKNRLHITAICTMELRKFLGVNGSKRPALSDIAESKQMEYDNNMIGMLYNDIHARRDSAEALWIEEKNGVVVKKPIVEIDIQKNKITDFKGTLYYKFSPEHSLFYECNSSEAGELKATYKAALKSMSDKRNPSNPKTGFMSSSEVDPW